MIINPGNAEHYTWGDNCDGWHLLKEDGISVIQERMPPGTEEVYHYHENARQLFHILSGKATFIVDRKTVEVSKGDSLHIHPGTAHKIINRTDEDITFLVISNPPSHGDRVMVEL